MVTKKKTATTTKHKSPAKSRAKKSTARVKVGTYQTLRVSPDYPAFFEARITKQTFYWSFLLLIIIIVQLAILAVNLNASLTLIR